MKSFDIVLFAVIMIVSFLVLCQVVRIKNQIRQLKFLLSNAILSRQQEPPATQPQQQVHVAINVQNQPTSTPESQVQYVQLNQAPIIVQQPLLYPALQVPIQPNACSEQQKHYNQYNSSFPTALLSEKVEVTENGDFIQIGNNMICRELSIKSNKISTSQIINRRTDGGQTTFTPQPQSEEFIIKICSPSKPVNIPALDKSKWSIKASSWSTKEVGGNGAPQCFIDGDKNTYWITNYGTGEGPKDYPHWVVIDLSQQQKFKAFSYTPLQNGPNYQAGNVVGFKLTIGNTEQELQNASPIKQGYFYYDGQSIDTMYVNLPVEVTARFVKFEPTGGLGAYGRSRTTAGGAQFSLHSDQIKDDGIYIKASNLVIQTHQVTDIQNGKKLEFKFSSHTVQNTVWNISLVYSMNDGTHFMRKYLELSIPSGQRTNQRIDYIDMESLYVQRSDQQWCHPLMASGDEAMHGHMISCGQPVFIQGMFFGIEFCMHETDIVDSRAYSRYYSGKTLEMLRQERRLTGDKFVTWPSITGAARATTIDVLNNDFLAYIRTIAVPSKMRTQYNSWFDWMLDIDSQNILKSFYEIERGLTTNGAAPMDSYVVDDGWNAYGAWKDSNTTGFWQFNDKFPNALREPKDFTDKVSSQFGLWLGPRGGYVYMDQFAKFLEQHGNGELNPASNDVCVSHKKYLQKLLEFFLDQQQRYNINYWKIDGFVAIPCPRCNEHHINGGFNSMYYMTELWERWGTMLETMRSEAASRGCTDYWINLTCYINPSPWLLKFANSVWIQVSEDMARQDVGMKRQVDQLLTYRDGRHHEFHKIRQFKFPNASIYNHDPIYGKTQTDLAGTMDDDEFRTYLFMIISRGTLLQNLYYSYNMIDEGQKWLITADALQWKQDNFHILSNSQQFGGSPDAGEVYGYSSWNESEGIISIRNPSDRQQQFTLKLDRDIGVTEGVQSLTRTSILNFRSAEKDDNTKLFSYGQQIQKQFQPGEAVIWQFSNTPDRMLPEILFVKCPNSVLVNVKFQKRVNIETAKFSINGNAVKSATLLADWRTVNLVLQNELSDKRTCTLDINDITDHNGLRTNLTQTFKYFSNQIINVMNFKTDLSNSDNLTEETDPSFGVNMVVFAKQGASLLYSYCVEGKSDFNISFVLNTNSINTKIISQEMQFFVKINAFGYLEFNAKGTKTVSKHIINDGNSYLISLNRERNGMVKIYINGALDSSFYETNKGIADLMEGSITIGDEQFTGKVGRVVLQDNALTYKENQELYDSLKRNQQTVRYF